MPDWVLFVPMVMLDLILLAVIIMHVLGRRGIIRVTQGDGSPLRKIPAKEWVFYGLVILVLHLMYFILTYRVIK